MSNVIACPGCHSNNVELLSEQTPESITDGSGEVHIDSNITGSSSAPSISSSASSENGTHGTSGFGMEPVSAYRCKDCEEEFDVFPKSF